MSLFTARKINEPPGENSQEPSAALPVDMYQHQGKLVLLVPIAGVTIDDISVSITDDLLTISGKRSLPDEVNDHDWFSQECQWGAFHRSVILPLSVDTDKVTAFYKQGILRVEMPIVEEEHTQIIRVKIEE